MSVSVEHLLICGQCPQIGRQHGIKNKAAIALTCKLNGNLKLIIAALLVFFRIIHVVLFDDITDFCTTLRTSISAI